MCPRVYVFQCDSIVLAIFPEIILVQGHRIGNTEVMKWTEQFFFECFRETNFSSKTIVKVSSDIPTIHPLRSRGEAQEDKRIKMLKNRPVTRCRLVMRLIDNDIVVKITGYLLPQPAVREHPHGAEKMFEPCGRMGANLQFTKIAITEHIPEGCQRLF